MDLSGKSAIVLGGTSGIGLSAVQQLEQAGAAVVAGSRSSTHIEQAASTTGTSVTYREIDVLDRAALSGLFEDTAPFDILVNCATGGERASGPFLEMDLDGFQGSFRKLWGYVNS
ncbi:MAG: SDR family NAD(P)-dependent oxidoreductase, partial [Pseudomonadota bacterium]|nr:SDR family NAD(P)-dependent oxidoreductase [Pseudomonadota bacterium]